MALPRTQSATGRVNSDARAIEILEALVQQLGVSRVVGLLAEISNRRSEAVLLSREPLKAAVWTHDAKILDRASRELDGD
jgi:hypothetical protein